MRQLADVLCIAAFAGTGLFASLAFAQAPAAPTGPRFVVVLDAAHGGDDQGGRLASGQPEKAFTLALSVRLRSLLAARGIQVVTTRETDTSVDPNHRAEVANHAQAGACLSLHATESGSGIHLFASSLSPAPHSSDRSSLLAPPMHFTAWKTAQAAWVNKSLALTGVLNSAIQQAGLNVTLGRTALPGIDSMTCPAVTIEVAPERGPGQTVKSTLDDPGYQSRVAEALAAAVLVWQTEARQP